MTWIAWFTFAVGVVIGYVYGRLRGHDGIDLDTPERKWMTIRDERSRTD